MRKPIVTFLILLSLLLSLSGAAADVPAQGLGLSAPETMRPYGLEELSLKIPQAGSLSVFVSFGSEAFPLYEAAWVPAGSLSLPLSGLALGGESLPRGNGVLAAELAVPEGVIREEMALRVLAPEKALSYVLLAREVLPNAKGEDVIADYQLAAPGRLLAALYHAQRPDVPLRTWSIDRVDTLPHHFRWDKRISGKPAEPGDYVLTFEVQGSAQGKLERHFVLEAEAPEAQALSLTPRGMFLPENEEPAAIWAAMTAPLTVVNIGDMQHQPIYSRPDPASETLGLVHGETAGVEVLEADIEGFAKVRAARHGDGAVVTGFIQGSKLKTVVPDTRYGILIDKATQTLSVYERGEEVGSLPVSTGIYVPPGKDSFDTLSGAFLTGDRIALFSSEGYQYAYALRIDGGNLMHQTGYQLKAGLPDFTAQQGTLGQKASHGCVRVDRRVSAQGLNAWWLYANIPRGTKVLVLPDGEDLPEAVSQPSVSEGFTSPDFQVDENPSEGSLALTEQSILMTFGGDCVLGSEENSKNAEESFHAAIVREGFDWPFSALQDILSGDDMSLVNLENVLKDNGAGRESRVHNFRGQESFAQILQLGSIEAVNLANNHFSDYGQDGKNSTRNALKVAEVNFSGYSSLYVYEKDGLRIGFGGIRETVYHQGKQRIADEIAHLKADKCDYIVYTCHFGNEYESRHNQTQTQMAHYAIDAGANLVIGHHPHVVQGIEEYQDGLIFYSLGNLVFGGNLELEAFDGLLARIQLNFSGKRLVNTRVKLIPIITSGTRPANDFRPFAARGEDKARILGLVNEDSAKVYPEEFMLSFPPGEP